MRETRPVPVGKAVQCPEKQPGPDDELFIKSVALFTLVPDSTDPSQLHTVSLQIELVDEDNLLKDNIFQHVEVHISRRSSVLRV
ncbi:hypothetical protein RRG08_062704 [Elysia crispata]|uniref:Uncharacterized protein n=1 Tax=Elysia crispata TaxID=231223 RepID=A0AAE1ABQ8_9GAST|nr:hypothetical protein RRG08_062704 [Elysia crispata]